MPHTRSFLEGLAIVDASKGGCRILNAGKDVGDKKIAGAVSLLKDLSEDQRNQLRDQFTVSEY